MRKGRETVLEVAGRKVVITNPDKLFFLQAGYTRLDLARYYAAVAEGPCGMARCRRGMERAHFALSF